MPGRRAPASKGKKATGSCELKSGSKNLWGTARIFSARAIFCPGFPMHPKNNYTVLVYPRSARDASSRSDPATYLRDPICAASSSPPAATPHPIQPRASAGSPPRSRDATTHMDRRRRGSLVGSVFTPTRTVEVIFLNNFVLPTWIQLHSMILSYQNVAPFCIM